MAQCLRKKEKQGQISTKKDYQKNINKSLEEENKIKEKLKIWSQLRQVCNGDLNNEMFK